MNNLYWACLKELLLNLVTSWREIPSHLEDLWRGEVRDLGRNLLILLIYVLGPILTVLAPFWAIVYRHYVLIGRVPRPKTKKKN